MGEFVVNPRRGPRAPARCRATVVCSRGQFEAHTEDIGSTGCQVVSPYSVPKGDGLRLVVTNEKMPDPLDVSGRVAWVSGQPPWRVGIAFHERSLPRSTRWFDRLVAAYPGLGGYRRVPDRIRTDAIVYLGPPPRFLLDFTQDEAMLLRAIGGGTPIADLMARHRHRWDAAQPALFSLLARQAATLQRAQAVHPDAWKEILKQIEASLAVESLGAAAPGHAAPGARAPTPAPAPPSPKPASLRSVARGQDRGADWTESSGRSRQEARAESARARQAARELSDRRNGEAQAAYDRAMERMREGSSDGALALLRLALSLAPGDREILEQIAKVESHRSPRRG